MYLLTCASCVCTYIRICSTILCYTITKQQCQINSHGLTRCLSSWQANPVGAPVDENSTITELPVTVTPRLMMVTLQNVSSKGTKILLRMESTSMASLSLATTRREYPRGRSSACWKLPDEPVYTSTV